MRQRLTPLLQLASIALTGWILWSARMGPLARHVSLETVIVRSATYALIAWGAGAAIALVLYLGVLQWEREDVIQGTLRTSSAAIWFAPAVFLLMALSPAAIAAAAVLIITATRVLYEDWRMRNPPLPEPPPPTGMFASAELPRPQFWRDAAPGLAASLTMQTGVVALLLHVPMLAGAAFAMSLAIVTIFAMTTRAVQPRRPRQSLPRAILGVLLTIVMAVGLTVAGLLPRWMQGNGDGFGLGTGSGAQSAQAPARPGAGSKRSSDPPQATSAVLPDGGFPGIILTPELKPYTTLIAPMPQRDDGLATVDRRPMSIPFAGEYWMFRWPFDRPPQTSLQQRGTPSTFSFRTTDHRPLQMEAHQKLDQSIALNCCRAIQLEIWNSDRYPNTIELELVLINNHLPRSPSISLGRQTVRSLPDVRRDPVGPVPETLDFAIPSAAPITAFNELKIVFFRARVRLDQSAKVAVERFVLQPRY